MTAEKAPATAPSAATHPAPTHLVSSAAEPAASSGRAARGHAFAPVSRARGYHRVGGPLIAAAGERRLTMSLERVAIANVTYRASQAPFEVATGTNAATCALSAFAATHQLSGRGEVALKVPYVRDSGADVAFASAYATLSAFAEATEMPLNRAVRVAMIAELGGVSPLPAEDGFGVHDVRDGSWVQTFDEAPRFYVQMWHSPLRSQMAAGQVGDAAAVGALVDLPRGHAEAGRALTEINGPVTGRVGEVLTSLLDDPHVFGLVGGHAEGDPVALLLGGDISCGSEAYRLRRFVEEKLGGDLGGMEATFVRQARIS